MIDFKFGDALTSDTSYSFRGLMLSCLSKRDADDLSRLQAKMGSPNIARYIAAQYMVASLVAPSLAAIYKTFGDKIESAYQEMVESIAILDQFNGKKASRRDNFAAYVSIASRMLAGIEIKNWGSVGPAYVTRNGDGTFNVDELKLSSVDTDTAARAIVNYFVI